METILVEDYKNNEVPQTMRNILTYLKNVDPTSSRNDILVCLIYVLFLESGFIPKEYDQSNIISHSFSYKNVKKFSLQLPVGWKKHNMYSFSFILPPFPQQEVILACIISAGDVLVNCIVTGIEEAQYTLCLDPLLYFSSSHCDVNSFNLQNMRHLSWNIKEYISYHAKQAILHQNSVVAECFEQLPPEIVLQIMTHLDFKHLIHFGQVNSMCNTIMKTPKLWINLLVKDFHLYMTKEVLSVKHATYENLRNIYKKQYIAKKTKLGRRNNMYHVTLFNFNV